MFTIFFAVGLYLLVMLLFSVGKGFPDSTTADDWALPNLKLSPFVVAVSITSTIVGGGAFVGVTQYGFRGGFVAIVIGVMYALGLLSVVRVVKRFTELQQRHHAKSLVDVVAKHLGPDIALMFALTCWVLYLLAASAQIAAVVEFLEALVSPDERLRSELLIVSGLGLSVYLYQRSGGTRRDVYADLFQFGLILLGIVALAGNIILRPTIYEKLSSRLPESYWGGTGLGVLFLIGVISFIAPMLVVRMDIWQRVVMARDENAAKVGLILAAVASGLCISAFGFIGMLAKANNISSNVTIVGAIEAFVQNDAMRAVVVIAFLAAVFTSFDTFLNNSAIFYAAIRNPPVSRRLATLRTGVLIAMGVAMICGWITRDVIAIFSSAFALIIVFLPLVLELMVDDKKSSKMLLFSCGSGLLVAMISIFVFAFFWPTEVQNAFIPGVVTTLLIYTVLKLLDAGRFKWFSKY